MTFFDIIYNARKYNFVKMLLRKNLEVEYIPQFSHCPASSEVHREEIVQSFCHVVKNEVNFLINGRDFTNKIFDAGEELPSGSDIRDIDGKKYILLPAGFDGVIMDYKNTDASIVLPTADCAGVIFVHPDQEKCGILHAGYKGTAAGIIDNLFEKLDSDAESLAKMFFQISPMAGGDFQLDTQYYKNLFEEYLEKHDIDAFSPNFFREIENGKCEFSLQKIIGEILRAHGIKLHQIYASSIETTDSDNNFYSFRLFSNYRTMREIVQNDVENFKLLPSGKEYVPPKFEVNYFDKLVKNPNHQTNSQNGRMASILKTTKK